MRFTEGRPVLYRNFSADRLVNVRPCRVVSDDDRGLLLWLARGTPVIIDVHRDGRGTRDMPFAEWAVAPRKRIVSTWAGPGVLKFIPPGADHSVWFFRTERDTFKNWYVNLEAHAIRWDDGDVAGVDVMDQDLDIHVDPDRTWRWKDEDEFAERLALPEHYWVPDPEAVWAEGRRVIKQIEAGEFPFDGTWTDFRPDPGWPVPAEIPPGWDRPGAR
ncbi:hypothetical protein ACWT_7152 [Actinoplanes sp. SE50]|uniref:DUF402 domain-containing protein n=1 Tax=unclassified Actinoplanes TaxID=2626549 RepID=UPI00023EDE3E|nr:MULTISPECIES: DUF402 domain-containing protein [unclassified Actinoplanes]AEV88162.1 hypothetical protein ACPL_7282 [Actinoplanes sp. SE50/110]ATO86567.1 hypothetical protein ACWT_7152 [Actinoplanes sp. SE50]SLM03984.1 hypothetical protein ACSP50_7283 [Actinoplanes sp. SE50/110]